MRSRSECYSGILKHFDTTKAPGSCLLPAQDERGVKAWVGSVVLTNMLPIEWQQTQMIWDCPGQVLRQC